MKYHDKKKELWVGFHRVHTGKPCITWPQSVDEALCLGWIDGLRKSFGAEAYLIRFTPRKQGSNWSAVNVKRAKELINLRLMQPAGKSAFEARLKSKTGVYSFEQKSVQLSGVLAKRFKSNKTAWKNFQSMAPWYRRAATWWVMSAKQEETRLRRLATLMDDSGNGIKIKSMRYGDK